MPTTASGPLSPAAELPAPALSRRMAAFVYEGILLFGVLMLAGGLYSVPTQQRHALHGTTGLQVVVFLVVGLYFSWFWSHGGQTVAMKAWRVKLVDAKGRPITAARAVLRYALCWLWFAPAWLAAYLAGLKDGSMFGVMFAGVVAYAAISRLSPQRQFWHDIVCGTRLVDVRPSKTTA